MAFTPIAMPSLAGPGSISVVLAAAGYIQSIHPTEWRLIYAAVIVGMIATLVLLPGAEGGGLDGQVSRPGGLDAMNRVFGFLLICVGMQFLLTGIRDFYGLRAG